MTWRERLRPATFRGVPFSIETQEYQGGRKAVIHEYPFRDDTFVEDLGKATQSFSIEAFILGKDYDRAKIALVTALEAEGPGALVLPLWPAVLVSVTGLRVREAFGTEGGIARFHLTFTRTAPQPFAPNAIRDGKSILGANADKARASTEAEFNKKYKPTGPGFTLASAANAMKKIGETVNKIVSPIVTATQTLAEIKQTIDNIILDADAIIRLPFEVAANLRDAVNALKSGPDIPALSLEGLLRAYGFAPDDNPPRTTPARTQEAENLDAMTTLFRRACLIEAARIAGTDIAYPSLEDATEQQRDLCGKLDEQCEIADDAAYGDLMQLRASIIETVPGEDTDIPRLLTYRPIITQSSLVIAYRLYGIEGAALEADLIARNSIHHPGFIIGGTELRVLSNG